MGRYGTNASYAHTCEAYRYGYEIAWSYDRYYSGSRLRFPARRSMTTDENGAKRFCKRHGIPFPLPMKAAEEET